MIRVLIPYNKEFKNFAPECKQLYEKSQTQIGDSNSFEFITKNTFFYMFLSDKTLIGAIYYFLDEEQKLFLNGFAKRKMFALNLECLKLSLTWFNCDIYAQAQNRASALCLLRCGFKRTEKRNVFVKYLHKLEHSSRKDNHDF